MQQPKQQPIQQKTTRNATSIIYTVTQFLPSQSCPTAWIFLDHCPQHGHATAFRICAEWHGFWWGWLRLVPSWWFIGWAVGGASGCIALWIKPPLAIIDRQCNVTYFRSVAMQKASYGCKSHTGSYSCNGFPIIIQTDACPKHIYVITYIWSYTHPYVDWVAMFKSHPELGQNKVATLRRSLIAVRVIAFVLPALHTINGWLQRIHGNRARGSHLFAHVHFLSTVSWNA